MKMIALPFFLISLNILIINLAFAQNNDQHAVTYESEKAICQIAKFKDLDVSQYCNGRIIFAPELNLLLIGMQHKSFNNFIRIKGDFIKPFYAYQKNDKYPILMNINQIEFENINHITNKKSSLCFLAATEIHKSVMIRCYAKGNNHISDFLIHINGLLE